MFQFFDPNSLTRKAKLNARANAGLVEIKCKFAAEFRRFSLNVNEPPSLEQFHDTIRSIHRLKEIQFCLTYTDKEGDLLPINNEDNFTHALRVSKPLLRISVQHANNRFQLQGFGGAQAKKNIISRLLEPDVPTMRTGKPIGMPQNFRYVSAIIDADILPLTQRRVKLIRDNSQKPLGFFVRDGFSTHPTSSGSLERVAGVFISRLVPGGLAEGTGLLAANDEVLEVNGIEVAGKTLDQVTDMMVANSGHLIITIKPCNQFSQVTLPQPANQNSLLIRSSFTDLSRTNSSGRRKKVDPRMSCSMHDLKAGGEGVVGEEMVNERVGVIGELRDVGKEEEDDDDVREFVRRDPSGSSASNRDSAQLIQQQQQLQQLKQLTMQKEQLEEQLRLQQNYESQKQQQHGAQQQQQYNYQHQQQKQFLQQYELQQHLKHRETLLPNYDEPQHTDNQPINTFDVINNNLISNNDTTQSTQVHDKNNILYDTNKSINNTNNSNNVNDNSWFSQKALNDNTQFVKHSIYPHPYNNHDNQQNLPINHDHSTNLSDLQHFTNLSPHLTKLQSSSNAHKDPTNNRKNLQMFSRNVMITDLQSLDQLDKSTYDEENIRFVEGGDYDHAEIFGNSSLRIAPASNRRNITASRSVDHHMKKRKPRL